ncbi:MAG: protein-glutamate O-methyltransferase CheR [Gemmatimonadetes bacterium]|nr:protein-glutamate O-methyltransferase CheR [Gemmatimonadota bacterium]
MSSHPLPWSGAAADVAELLRQRTGLVFGEARRTALEAGLGRAMRRIRVTDPAVYLARLAAEPPLLDDLVGEITVGETYFFRDPQQFAVIRDDVVPDLLSRWARDRPLRAWSAGCATGEEPYTLAIVLREQGLAGAAHIVATDLSRTALAQARRALYTRWSLRGVSDDVVQTYFERVGDRFALAAAVRDAVEFRYLNLAEDTYPSLATGIWGMDLILCRNVLIYFDGETVARVARRLMDSLRDDGWLLLGGSDPPLAGLVPSDVVLTGAGLAYRRPGRGAIRPRATDVVAATFPLPPFAEPLATKRPAPSPVPPPRGEPRREPVRGERESLVQEQQALDDAADATRCYAERDYERAAELARRLVQRDGSDPALWVVLVRALANRGELEAAGRACAAALDRHRTATELVYLHALLLSEAGRHAEAAAAARRALYLDRWLVVAHLALGAAFARLGEVDGACRAFRNAKRLLTGMPPGEIVPASDGQAAGRLAEMARVQLQLLGEAAA